MSQLRSDILRKRKRAEIEKSETLYKKNHIIPIQPYDEISDNENSGNEEDIVGISDDEDGNNENLTTPAKERSELNTLDDDEPDTIYSTDQWMNVIQNWINMAGKESNSNISDKESSTDPLTFIAVDRTIHPADDPLAKWKLKDIFNNRLESPAFVNALINLD
jgi:hypothetical protein